jgi:hypothetical protein
MDNQRVFYTDGLWKCAGCEEVLESGTAYRDSRGEFYHDLGCVRRRAKRNDESIAVEQVEIGLALPRPRRHAGTGWFGEPINDDEARWSAVD